MFMKQYNYKPRSNSSSSQGSTSGTALAGSPPKETTKPATATTTTNTQNTGGAKSGAIAGRRRSSASSEKFAGLNAHKRSSQDESTAARKASWAEQKPGQAGILGGMWNSFTKGT